MSHFNVIVIGPNVEAQLQPYHEFECTGMNDKYVVDVDITDETVARYAEDTSTLYVLPGNRRVTRDDPRLYREITAEEHADAGPLGFIGSGFGGGRPPFESKDWGDSKGRRAKIFDPAAAGATEIEVPTRERMSLVEFVEYERGEQCVVGPDQIPDTDGAAKYGYVRVDATGKVIAVIDRTNQNAKWDYWRIGGRWSGFLLIRPDNAANYRKPQRTWDGPATISPGVADQCTIAQLDVDRARSEAAGEANAMFDKWDRLVAEHGRAMSWTEMRAAVGDIDKARVAYRSQPLVEAAGRPEENGGLGFRFGCWVEDLGYDRTSYVRRCENAAMVPYAVVKDGKWHAKGTMGWWGVSHDEDDESSWNEQFHRLLSDLAPDTLLTVVDCHI